MYNSAQWLEEDFRSVWHPYTRFSSLEDHDLPVIERGEGVYLFDVEGRRYIDAIASWWCCALGHSHPAIVSAIQEQAGRLQHSILGNMTHPQAIRLASRLAGTLPTPDRHTLFASDGASAIEQAVKIAVQFRVNSGEPERKRFASFHAAYHGDTLGSMSLGYVEGFHRPFKPLLFDTVQLPFPCCTCLGQQGPCDCVCFQESARLLEPHAEELTAVVVEPLLQGAAGMRIHGAAWLKALEGWCRQRGILLILDEIATGFGRTGTLYAHQQAGVDPDILCLGKGLTGGTLPLSATVVKDFIYHTFVDLDEDYTLQHGHTYCGNPIAAAAANAALDLLLDKRFLGRVHRLAEIMETGVQAAKSLPGVVDVRSLGVMAAIELEHHQGPPAQSRAHRVRKVLQDQGVLLRPIGDVLYLMPPLIIEPEVLEDLIQVWIQAVS